jgi:CheY-like chemotaxis protein
LVDDIVKICGALSGIIGSTAWPPVALIVLWWFRASIRTFLNGVSEGTFKAFGVEATARRAAVTEALVTAESKTLPKEESIEIQHTPGVGKSWRLAEFVASSGYFERLSGRSILWVDDQPQNNLSERLALVSLGLNVTTATTTQEAIARLHNQNFDIVVSDMQRPEGKTAGYDLLSEIKADGINVPVVFYRGSHSTKLEKEALEKGAFGSTNEVVDLIILIANALRATGKVDFGRDHHRRLRELRALVAHHPAFSYKR